MDESDNQYVTGFGKSVPRDLNENSTIVFLQRLVKQQHNRQVIDAVAPIGDSKNGILPETGRYQAFA
jgi:hypothetical protein